MDSFVANDIHLDRQSTITILTGPNYSGKSVYLKQVAVVLYMAHIGSFVPATSAEIGWIDKLFTRIQTRESVGKVSSPLQSILLSFM